MNVRKGAVAAAAALLLGLGVYGSTSATVSAAPRKFVVGVSMYTLTNPYFAAMRQSFVQTGKRLGVTVDVASANGDQATQLAQVETFIQEHVNAVVIAPQNSDAIVTAVEALNKAKIPVFFVDSNANPALMKKDHAREVEVVQSNNSLGGRVIGQELIKYLGPHPHATVGIVNFPEAQSCRLRDAGFLSVIKKYPGIKVVSTIDGKAQPTVGLQVGTDMITGHPKMNIIFSDNGPDSQGLVQAIRSESKIGKVFLFGFSSARQNIDYILQNNIFKAGAQQLPRTEATTELGNIKKYLLGKKIPPVVLVPVPGVTKANAKGALTRSFG